jgi:mannose-6-phosphate isomerase-like protein (cupin superfamily)
MQGYFGNIEKETKENTFFRKVLYTDAKSQLVVMSLPPQEEIGSETHPYLDQFLRFEEGEGKVVLGGEELIVSDGYAVIVPAGVEHNVINISGTSPLKLYTIYTPPQHHDGTIHKTKADAEADEQHH